MPAPTPFLGTVVVEDLKLVVLGDYRPPKLRAWLLVFAMKELVGPPRRGAV